MKTVFCLICCIAVYFHSEGQQNNVENKIQVVAHRGDWRNYPENSVRAFVSSADMGVDIVELDLALIIQTDRPMELLQFLQSKHLHN